ncbi:hypothetical protein BEWA_048660 [Theileria equi strain WA]|uniref:Uncharacterized protein n=1 Tax=Theileria equi strain WA TaxID=1537102 RepID=L1LAV7_THEEQ|nr:hypothetical protein BEWA_048660 [Theileria equi strain WA]EKX72399.1 hypothetical protein BEWA_048660 [Theileria equi strain WA]|eukprot:XP_004831851.1 hypothetical protein BEWA_048660 [Theileria equi strain WA]
METLQGLGVAVLVTRDNKNKQGTVYRYHDGKQWKDGKEEDHKKNLDALKTKAKNHHIAKQSPVQLTPKQAAQPVQEPPKPTADKPVEAPAPKEEPTESSKQSGDTTLDISKPDKDKSQSFDYTFAGNAIRLVVPNKGISVSKLVSGTEEVYTLSAGEMLEYIRVYLNKDKKPELASVTLQTSSGVLRRDYVKSENGWVFCTDTDAKMKNLKDTTEWKSNFEIDLSASKDTDECRVFEAELLGVTTKHFFPTPGYHAKKGVYARWNGYFDDYCLSCLIHKRGNIELLVMIVVERLTRRWKYFEKNADGWKDLTRDEFDRKIEEIKG